MKMGEHLKQKFFYGGKIETLGAIIIDLQKITSNQRCIDVYIIGLFQSQNPIQE